MESNATESTIRIGQTRLYSVLKEGSKFIGPGLGTEEKNFEWLYRGELEQKESWHSVRSEFNAQTLQLALQESGHSIAVDLASCDAGKIENELIERVSIQSSNTLENLTRDVSKMKTGEPGQMIIVVACECERTKDSRRIQDADSAQWSYLGDPSIMAVGLVPGEQQFNISKVEVIADGSLHAYEYKMNCVKGNYISELVGAFKKTLILSADPTSYEPDKCLWSNFYSAADVFALLKSGLESGIIKEGFKITFWNESEQLEFQLKILKQNSYELKLGAYEHGFVRDFGTAIGKFMSRSLDELGEWSQENSYLYAARAVLLGTFGYHLYRLLVYASVCHQINACAGMPFEDVITSRILNECFGMYPAAEWPSELSSTIFSETVVKVLAGCEDVQWFGNSIRSTDLKEADSPGFDNDAKGVASERTIHLPFRLNGISLWPGHGIPLNQHGDALRFRLKGKRVEIRMNSGLVESSVRFNPHDLLRVITMIREVELATGKIVWGECQSNGWYQVTNSMLNFLIAGGAGRKPAMWVLARIMFGDLKLQEGYNHACYAVGAELSPNSIYRMEVALSRDVLMAVHTYTNGTELWADFKDNGELWKIEKTQGRLCHIYKIQSPPTVELEECSIRSTLRAKDSEYFKGSSC